MSDATPGKNPNGRAGPAPPPGGRWFFLLAVVIALAMLQLRAPGPGARRIAYSEFLAYADSGRVARVVVHDSYIIGTLKSADSLGRTQFVTNRLDPALVEQLRGRGIELAAETQDRVFDVLITWGLPTVLFLGLWFFFLRRVIGQQAAGVLGFGKSGAKAYSEEFTKITFADVAGVDEAKAELQEVVSFLRNPAGFGRLGARIPKGVLLVGPPGTGKTLLARAVAGEAKVRFFSINGSEFVELFVGIGAARVRDLFAQARQHPPCIIFIDELDALGRTRGFGVVGGGADEKEQTLNQLLAELDGFTPEGGVILLAATNRPEILDPALLRAGRFDRQILVDRPDRKGRTEILRVHARRVKLDPAVDLDKVAAITPGFTGADIAGLVNEAALGATRRGSDAVTLDDFSAAVERVVAGLARKSRVLSERERRITAVHEMGHTLVALATPSADPVHKVSIIPHGLGALGFTLQRPTEDRYIATRAELEARMTVLLGGRAAELVVFGELSTGAADDLVKATELAREMVMRHGMDATVGSVAYGERAPAMLGPNAVVAPESRLYSEATAREIERAVRTLVHEALDRAVALLTLNRDALDAGARTLQERETLTQDELPAVVAPPGARTHNPARRRAHIRARDGVAHT